MINPSETIAKLRQHATRMGPEAETARRILLDMGENPDEMPVEIGSLEVRSDGSWHQTQLFVYICDYLGVEAHQIKGQPTRKIVRGTKYLCEAVAKLFAHMKEHLAELHRGTTMGYLGGALPMPSDPKNKTITLGNDAIEAARAAHGIGLRSQPNKQLPPKKD